mgnify:CR=1 FL=1
MRSRLYILLLWAVALLSITEADGQELKPSSTVAEERVQVSASSATVLQWFGLIEQQCGIVLSYNPAQIDLTKVCTVEAGGSMTVARLLSHVLKDYKFKTAFVPPRKLVIQVQKQEDYYVRGKVGEADADERLYGAVVSWSNGIRQWNTLTDENGIFKLYLPEGLYTLTVSYMGYTPYTKRISISRDCFLDLSLQPLLFEIDEVTVQPEKRADELTELNPSNLLAFSGNDLFSQIWILPGVTSSLAGSNLQVDGGGPDENQFLLDGVPVYHPGHFSSLLPMFNGDAVKNVVFHKSFFPTRLEGRLSSVTEVNLKEGNKDEHVRTLSLDMPAASVMLEGPIVKQKLSYMVSARRSWLDFFDNLLSEDNRLNHSSCDYNAKLSYAVSPLSTLSFLAYGARDDYHLPVADGETSSILRWENQVYQLAYRTQWGKVSNSTSLFYSSYSNRALVDGLGLDGEGYVRSGIKSLNALTEFSYSPENLYRARWGVKYAYETYDLATLGDKVSTRREPVSQVSVFYDNSINISSRFSVQVGVHGVGYYPRNHRSYYSIQPRLSVKYFPTENDLLYLHFSKMEQFYHYLRFSSWALPTDFRMPSIDGYKPRSSEHYEIGWKHFLEGGRLEASIYYKTRRNVVALRPETFIEDGPWQEYIMSGNGDSYGIKFYLYKSWSRWKLQLSYAYTRSREWFAEVENKKKLPSLYDVPHQLGSALSFQLNARSLVSIGGMLRSGKVIDLDEWFDPLPAADFRMCREPLNYRVDVGYSYKKSFGDKLLSFRCGLYNVIGNPSEEDILSFYSVHWHSNCLPYAGISFKF